MQRIEYHFFCGTFFYDLSGIHNHDIVSYIIKKRQLMCDEDHGFDKSFFHQVTHHFDNHFLGSYIQCGRRLIGDQHLRRKNGRNCDNGSLFHTTGKLNRMLLQYLLRQA